MVDLPAPLGPTRGDPIAGLGGEGKCAEHRQIGARGIAEIDVGEFDGTAEAREGFGIGD